MSKLQVIITSTRPGRAGLPIGNWFFEHARAHGKFEVERIDLEDVGLPLLDEPEHPRLQKYQHEHTKAWSSIVSRADAYVFVVPEYNYSPPPSFLNAIDYLYKEWNYKAAGFVSYGGISGGLRSLQACKLPVTTVKMMPMMEAVAIPFFSKHLVDGAFKAEKMHEDSANVLLDELHKWAEALRPLRA